MINIDQHVHTNISHDGISSMYEYINSAKEKNIDEITFTEHYDDYTGLDTTLKTLNVDKYRDEYLKYSKSENI